MHKDNEKEGPFGMSQNDAFNLPESWGSCNCLLKVDKAIVWEAMGGDEIVYIVSVEFLQLAKAAYDTLVIKDLNLGNIWHVSLSSSVLMLNFWWLSLMYQ